MNKQGPIVLIDDDRDDIDLMREIIQDLALPNELKTFRSGVEAIQYLHTSAKPFLILADINMPIMNGFELRKAIQGDAALNDKCIPFIFYSTSVSTQTVQAAYKQSVQGIFEKPSQYDKWKDTIGLIVAYWKECEA